MHQWLGQRYVILAGDHRQVTWCATHVLRVHPTAVVSVDGPEKLMGLGRGTKVYLYGTFYTRPGYRKMAALIRERGLVAEYLYDRDLGADTVPHPLA